MSHRRNFYLNQVVHLDYFVSNYMLHCYLKKIEFKNLDGSMFFTQLIKSFENIPL